MHRPLDLPRKGFPLNADPADQLRLLDIAEQDARLAQLTHRRRTLPEIAEIERLSELRATVSDRIIGAETEAGDVAREVAKAETDVEQVRARSGRDQDRLDSGAITSAKELESLQHEIGSLAKRQADLEDIELEILERQEEANRVLAELRQESTDLDVQLAQATHTRDEAFAEMDKDAGFVIEGRASLAGSVSAELLALYEKIRAKQGVGAAALHRGQCGACRMQINSTEMGEIRDGRARRRPASRGLRRHLGPHGRVGAVTRRFIVEADGGARGNPGQAAYGALVRDPECGEVLLERGERIGIASNNVAEYRGLIAGLEAVRPARPGRAGRGADGLQARRRADVGSLAGEAPRHEEARQAGLRRVPQRPGQLHLDPAREEQGRGPARQRRPGRHVDRGPARPRRATRIQVWVRIG